MTKTIEELPFLDSTSTAFLTDPMAVLDDVRRQSWIARTPLGAMVLDRQHVQLLLADRRLRSPLREFIELQGVTDGVLHDRLCDTLLGIEGADHTRLRTLVRKAFVPSAVDRHRPVMRSILQPLIDAAVPGGRCDLMAAVAEHYPIQVMCHLLGVPAEDHELLTAWSKGIAWALSLQLAAHLDEAEAGMVAMDHYVRALVADRREAPRNDLVTELAKAEDGGDRLSDDELQSLIIGLLFAGYDTTRNQLGLAVWVFAQHPDQWALLALRPELAPAAVEEVMRFRGAVDAAPRLVAEDFELDGVQLVAGTFVMLSTAAANHDPAAWAEPHLFDITAQRSGSLQQLTFGGGPHYCLGAGLARAELQEALPLLAAAMPDLALDGEPTWRPPMGIFGPEALPIRFRA